MLQYSNVMTGGVPVICVAHAPTCCQGFLTTVATGRRWVTLRLNFTFEDYVSRQYIPSYGPLDWGQTGQQHCRWMFSHKLRLIALELYF